MQMNPQSQNVIWLAKSTSHGAHDWGNTSFWFLGDDSTATLSINTLTGTPAYPNNSALYTYNVYIPTDTVTKDNSSPSSTDNIAIGGLNISAGGALVVSSSNAGADPNVVEVTGVTTLTDNSVRLLVR